MDLKEYEKIKNLKYLDYCKYLQDKYGILDEPYMTAKFKKNKRATRTSKEGLFLHHIHENEMILLSHEEIACKFPYEWQKPLNLVPCDLLEHFYLHILICEDPKPISSKIAVGVGGITNFIGPELNDIYSGWKSTQTWREKYFNRVKQNKDLYLILIQRYIINSYCKPNLSDLTKSFNALCGNNICDLTKLNKEIESIYNKNIKLSNGKFIDIKHI